MKGVINNSDGIRQPREARLGAAKVIEAKCKNRRAVVIR
jgi:hypothetical protein